MDPKLSRLKAEFNQIEENLGRGGVVPAELKELSRRHAELLPVVAKIDQLTQIEKELADLDGLSRDKEFIELAQAEKAKLGEKAKALELELRSELIPKDPND